MTQILTHRYSFYLHKEKDIYEIFLRLTRKSRITEEFKLKFYAENHMRKVHTWARDDNRQG